MSGTQGLWYSSTCQRFHSILPNEVQHGVFYKTESLVLRKSPKLEDQGAVQSGPSPLNQSGIVEQARSDRLLPSLLLESQGHASLPTASRHSTRGGKNYFAFQMVCNRERMFTRHLQSSHIVWWSVNNCSIFASLMICRNHRQSKEINKNIIKPVFAPFCIISFFSTEITRDGH